MKKRIFALLLSITLLFSAVVTPVSAESVNHFTVKVSDATATAGDNRVAVDILIENNPGVAGFSFCVNYDTEKLVLVETEINIEGGYKVIAQPTGYGVNLAWTGSSGYWKNGKIATLYFNVPKDLATSEANIDIVYRDGYDSFYDSHEHDIAVQTVCGTVSIAALQETDQPSVNIGGVSGSFGDTDIVVPITVKNNPGFSGFSFCVNYDTSRLVLKSTKILFVGGYQVIGHPQGYAVNIAWTSTEAYTQDGTIAELHFSLKDNANAGKAYINAAFREGYDSFYGFVNGTEQDIAFDAFNGYVDVNSHLFGEWVVTKPATCTETGVKTRTCSDCSKVETVAISKIAHEYVAVVTAPTCTAKGHTTHTCKTCPHYYIDTYVDMVEHTLGQWEEKIAPECEVKGEEIQKCTVCQTTINTRIVDETGHDFDEWFVVSEAKFNEDGQERRDCKRCDHFETKRIPQLSEGHICDYAGTEEIIDHATCTKKGSKKVFCTTSECGKYITVEIDVTGHGMGNWYTVTAATFSEDGQERRDCANCDYFETNRLPKLSEDHVCSFTGKEVVVKEASCTASGSKKVYCTATECGKYTTVHIDPTGHIEGGWGVKNAATCTTAGMEVKLCTLCAKELETRPIAAYGHAWDNGTVTTAPDCLNDGVRTFRCGNCAETRTERINATGHTGGQWNVVTEATCTTAGSMEQRCTNCQALIAIDRIVAIGHSEGSWEVLQAASCTESGTEVTRCTICEDVLATRNTDPTGHQYQNGVCIHCGEEAPNASILCGTVISYGSSTDDVTMCIYEKDSSVALRTLMLKEGSFTVTDLPSGEYRVTFSKKNHVTREYAVTLEGGETVVDAKICLFGDVTGDGKINIADTGKVYARVKGSTELTDYAFACADVSGDGKINVADTGRIYAHVKGTKELF